MSDKPLSVDEIMKLVERYASARTQVVVGAFGSVIQDQYRQDSLDLSDRIRAELEKLTKAAAEDDLFPCCSRRSTGDPECTAGDGCPVHPHIHQLHHPNVSW